MKTSTLSINCVRLFASLLICCFGLLPNTQAVLPAPDGGYGPPAYGLGNTAEGQDALLSLTAGAFNTATGYLSLQSNTTGNFNTAIGAGALLNNLGDQNTATGAGALLRNTTGSFNTAVGEAALFSNTTGDQNTATGLLALQRNTTGNFNTASGVNALPKNTTGSGNTAAGWDALFDNTTGLENTAIGFQALSDNTTGRRNTVLGVLAGSAVTTANNVICIGANVAGANANNSCYIGNIFGQTSSGGSAVFINANGKLGTATSSRRFKEDIKPMDKASETLFALNPVSFRYKKEIDPTGMSQLGLVAEDVEKVDPDLAVRDNEGKPYSVRYDQVNAMLLNEFLKEHRKVEQQGATIAQLKSADAKQEATITQQQKQIEALTAGLQKVSAQLDASKPAPRLVGNNR